MATTTIPYNPFDYLESKEEINEYLTNAFMDECLVSIWWRSPHIFILRMALMKFFLRDFPLFPAQGRVVGINRVPR